MKTTEQINKEHYAQCVSKLHAIGLPEVAGKLNPNPWNFSPDAIILDVHNKALVCRNGWAHHIAGVLSTFFDGEIRECNFSRDGMTAHYFTTDCNLTVPDRRAIELFVHYFDKYYPGVEADSQEIVFPKAMSAYGAPVAFVEETDAYEAAEVLAELTRSEIIEVLKTEEGYAVVMRDDCGDLTDYNFACVLGACRVLEDFSVTRKQKELLEINDEREGTQPWQIAIGKHYTQQARMEAKVDQVLAGAAGRNDSLLAQKLDEILLRLSRMEVKQRLAEPAGC